MVSYLGYKILCAIFILMVLGVTRVYAQDQYVLDLSKGTYQGDITYSNNKLKLQSSINEINLDTDEELATGNTTYNHYFESTISGGNIASGFPTDSEYGMWYWNNSADVKTRYVWGMEFNPDLEVIYISDDNEGVVVVDTLGQDDPDNFTRLGKYTNSGTPNIGAYRIHVTRYDNESGLLYIGRVFPYGFVIVDTKKTKTLADDVLVATIDNLDDYGASSAAIGQVYDIDVDEQEGYVFIATQNTGVLVVDTQGDANAANDVLLHNYSTTSTPISIPSNSTTGIIYDSSTNEIIFSSGGIQFMGLNDISNFSDDNLYTPHTGRLVTMVDDEYMTIDNSTSSGGFKIIDTQNTFDTTDDVLVYNYSANFNTYDSSLASCSAENGAYVDGILYVAYYFNCNSGRFRVYSVDLGTPSALTLLQDTASHPELISKSYTHNFTLSPDSKYMYVSALNADNPISDGWLAIVNHDGGNDQNSYAEYVSRIIYQEEEEPDILRTYNGSGSNDNYQLSYRYGTERAAWEEDFSDNNNLVYGDFYYYYDVPNKVSVVDGLLKVQPATTYSSNWFWLDTGSGFPAGSKLTARVRLNTSETNSGIYMYTDDWEDDFTYANAINEWMILSIEPDKPFSHIGFELDHNNTWTTSEFLEIDWVRVETALSGDESFTPVLEEFDTSATTSDFGSGYHFNDIGFTDSKLILSAPNQNFSGQISIELNPTADYFPANSLVQVKSKLTSSTITKFNYDQRFFVDNYEGDLAYMYPEINQWNIQSFVPGDTFNTVGFEANWNFGDFQSGDKIEIDWIKVTAPSGWSSWFICSDNEYCEVANAANEDQQLFQYRLAMNSSVGSLALIDRIEEVDGLPTFGTYTSEVIDSNKTIVDWDELFYSVTSSTGDYVISVMTRGGFTSTPDSSWTDWQELNSPIPTVDTRYLQVRFVISTQNSIYPPEIANVYLTSDSSSLAATGANTQWITLAAFVSSVIMLGLRMIRKKLASRNYITKYI